ncbi:kinase-like protein [Phanerochaete sordida]|uniref:non-specific serine/threonine protein kinase n=1 Tax=Phanerochaete sordida TaxID=48140 RepID=A0A9P3G9T6_9APHY|nr:kinase-like protein [Phanerochaete sordida]
MASPTPERELTDFYDARPGEVLNGTYKLLVTLGGGIYSKTWLAKSDSRGKTTAYHAIKILSRDATIEVREGIMLEVDVMKNLRDLGGHPRLPTLFEDFSILHGSHICLAMNVLGSDVGSFRRSAPNKALPLHVVRVIMLQVIDAVAHLHKHGIVHTDIKPDNILFHTNMGAQEIDNWLANVGDRTEPTPLPHDWATFCDPEEAMQMRVSLVDLGQCQWANRTPTVSQFSAFSLRAPEVILKTDFGPGIDIWAIGCIIFEMLVGRWLFHPVDGEDDWSIEDDHLAKMMELTGEAFDETILARSPLRDQYFDESGSLLRVDELYPISVEDAMANYRIMETGDIKPAADVIRRCCHLDPKNRATAEDLCKDSWFDSVAPVLDWSASAP